MGRPDGMRTVAHASVVANKAACQCDAPALKVTKEGLVAALDGWMALNFPPYLVESSRLHGVVVQKTSELIPVVEVPVDGEVR